MSPWRKYTYPPPKNPFEVFMLGLSLLAVSPLLVGQSGSQTLEHELSDTAVVLWGVSLLVGTAMALAGLALPKGKRRIGLVWERGGLILVCGAAAIYSTIILEAAADVGEVRYTAAIHLAYSLACGWRVFQITKQLNWIDNVMTPAMRQMEEGGGVVRPDDPTGPR